MLDVLATVCDNMCMPDHHHLPRAARAIRRLLAITVLGAALATSCGTALASPPQPTSSTARMLRAAHDYWQARLGDNLCSVVAGNWTCKLVWGGPACGHPILRHVWGTGTSTRVQADSWAYVLPSGVYTCRIDLVSSFWTAHQEQAHYSLYCRLMAHEYAHLLGMWDVPSKNNMLSHMITDRVTDPYC